MKALRGSMERACSRPLLGLIGPVEAAPDHPSKTPSSCRDAGRRRIRGPDLSGSPPTSHLHQGQGRQGSKLRQGGLPRCVENSCRIGSSKGRFRKRASVLQTRTLSWPVRATVADRASRGINQAWTRSRLGASSFSSRLGNKRLDLNTGASSPGLSSSRASRHSG